MRLFTTRRQITKIKRLMLCKKETSKFHQEAEEKELFNSAYQMKATIG
jgi:hypothetical protein